MSQHEASDAKDTDSRSMELLVVISIMTLLVSILLPCLGRAKEHARRTACQNNLHQGLLAGNMYAGDYDGFLPEGNIIDKSAPGYNSSWDSADLLTVVNFRTMMAFGGYGLTEEHATCETARKHFESTEGWLSPLPAPRPLVPDRLHRLDLLGQPGRLDRPEHGQEVHHGQEGHGPSPPRIRS